MTAKSIFMKTMPFNWLKLLLGLATVLISALLFALCMGLGLLFGENGAAIMFLLWLSATGVVRFVIMHYFGYLVKAGHVAIIATAVTTGQVPANQVAVAKEMVKSRFGTSNVYFVIDKLVSGAVKQLQRVLDKAGNLLGGIPGVETVMNIGKMFIEISLGYIDECCLGYTFYKSGQGAFKSAADGVVIYAQNWKKLLKNAAVTTAVVILSVIGVTIVSFLLFGGLFTLFNWNRFVAFLLALFTALAVKFAFIDSWILVKMMVSYMQVAPSTVITFDLYEKLCGVSSKFKELWNRGQQERPSRPATPAYAAAGAGYAAPGMQPGAEAAGAKTRFCPECGAKLSADTKFCGSCGAKVS